MEKKELAKSLMLTVRALGIEEEMRQELNLKDASKLRPERTSNGYEIYYDEESGESVGIVYNGIVHLKRTSPERMHWCRAVKYCKTVVINGIQSELCPVDNIWRKEFKKIHGALSIALAEIGAEHLDLYTWCSEYDYDDSNAWGQGFSGGSFYYGSKDYYNSYVRPVLVLKS